MLWITSVKQIFYVWRLDKLALQEMLLPYLDAESNWAEDMLQQLQNWCIFELTPDSSYREKEFGIEN